MGPEQNFATIAPYTIEEAYEVADAIERGDIAALKDELGDLLLQVVFHARMAEEAGPFAFDDVAAAIADKMVRRHPHVFGDAEIALGRGADRGLGGAQGGGAREAARRPATACSTAWRSPCPPCCAPRRSQRRAARDRLRLAGRARRSSPRSPRKSPSSRPSSTADADADGAEDEMGDVLFAAANLARKLDIDPKRRCAAPTPSSSAASAGRRPGARRDERGAGSESIRDRRTCEMHSKWQAGQDPLEALRVGPGCEAASSGLSLMHSLPVPQAAEIGVGEADREVGGLAVVAAAEHLAVLVDPGQGLAVAQRHVEPHRPRAVFEAGGRSAQSSAVAPLAGRRRQRDDLRYCAAPGSRGWRARPAPSRSILFSDLDQPVLGRSRRARDRRAPPARRRAAPRCRGDARRGHGR